ncbi:MAG: hypothetical protein IJJ47_01660 [Methanosphaera sp.]|nr:hypothetical protein [Methanosphaera sp.]
MIQCRLCGCKFDESKVDKTKCNCGFDCHGTNVLCPNCGFDVPVPKHLRQNDLKKDSLFSKLKKSVKK